ncbi:hypothetical protein CJJ23_00565 [Mycoplasmopsis agassizii]|uniref:Ribulose-phosphate 3-epimerase n=1 Tax=Mycoplasmopsis agassizii TaxID=33922 RepID=A0A269TKD6_9BACT|nr:ribulose-phosphate 3-epimerase [Mycoplasmopsis agassizii]PAK21620.1 hypothetical protein CJJ23_00565 [Mycoplasmopsis agassizii]
MWKKDRLITPSILNVKPEDRRMVILNLLNFGIKWIHYDMMDGEFVPNTAISIEEFINLRKRTDEHIADVHLMVKDPQNWIDPLLAWTDFITMHIESFANPDDVLAIFEKYKHTAKFGLSVKPNTNIEILRPYLKYLSLVLIMSVEPGKGGQEFIDSSLDKVKELRLMMLEEETPKIKIQIDGGINNITVKKAFAAGVDAAVSGSYLINNLKIETIAEMLKKD